MFHVKDLVKLEILHSTLGISESSNFVIDFQNKEAYYDPNFKLKIKDKIHLSNESLTNFLNAIDEIKFIEDLQNIEDYTLNYLKSYENLHTLKLSLHTNITFSNQFAFICYFKDCIKHYFVQWRYPNSWFDFSKILTDLVDFDVLDTKNSEKWINNFNYDIKKDGIFYNNEKLILKQFKFNYHGSITNLDDCSSFFIIDFIKNQIHSKGKILEKNITQDDLKCFLELIIKYEIYLWENEKYWKNVYDSTGSWCDGYHWSIQLTFNNDSIFYIGGHCTHPDLYFSFAKEFKNIFSEDLLRLNECIIPNRIKYPNLFK